MVKLTVDLVLKNTGQIRRQRDESLQHFARRVTHAYCNEKNIDDIENIAGCRSLSVLYLYDNHIKNFSKLTNLYNLTHLYLQNNKITKLESLHSLKKLTKIYLGGNEIAVLEGLEKISNLTELRIENQRLSPGEKLLFDPRSLAALSRSVQVLDVSGNGLDSLSDFYNFESLIHFTATNNAICDVQNLKAAFYSWLSVTTIDLSGNPVCTKPKYRDQMLVICPSSVVMIDGKGVNQTARQFLIKMQMNKGHKKGNRGQKISKKKAKQPRQQNFALISSDYLNSAVPLPVPNIKLARAAAFRQVDMLSKISPSDPYQFPNLNAGKTSINPVIHRQEKALQRKEYNNLVHSQSASKQLMMMAVGGIDPYN